MSLFLDGYLNISPIYYIIKNVTFRIILTKNSTFLNNQIWEI